MTDTKTDPKKLTDAQKAEFVTAYKDAYGKARQELPVQAPNPGAGVPVGQGYHEGTDEEIGDTLVAELITTKEQAETLARERAYRDAGVALPAPAGKGKGAEAENAKAGSKP